MPFESTDKNQTRLSKFKLLSPLQELGISNRYKTFTNAMARDYKVFGVRDE